MSNTLSDSDQAILDSLLLRKPTPALDLPMQTAGACGAGIETTQSGEIHLPKGPEESRGTSGTGAEEATREALRGLPEGC